MAAEALGVGSCLMDSIYLAFRTNRKLRRRFSIDDDVLGALVLGYSDERIVNVPKGYELGVRYNAGAS